MSLNSCRNLSILLLRSSFSLGRTVSVRTRATFLTSSPGLDSRKPLSNRSSDNLSISKSDGHAASSRREHEKSATKRYDSILHEDVELGGREPLQPQQCCQKKEPDEICVAVDD